MAVADITEVDEPDFLHGRAVRINIFFLSVFDVRIERSPTARRCQIRVRQIRPANSSMPSSGSATNKANTIGIVAADNVISPEGAGPPASAV
jgi:hypothetical protein